MLLGVQVLCDDVAAHAGYKSQINGSLSIRRSLEIIDSKCKNHSHTTCTIMSTNEILSLNFQVSGGQTPIISSEYGYLLLMSLLLST